MGRSEVLLGATFRTNGQGSAAAGARIGILARIQLLLTRTRRALTRRMARMDRSKQMGLLIASGIVGVVVVSIVAALIGAGLGLLCGLLLGSMLGSLGIVLTFGISLALGAASGAYTGAILGAIIGGVAGARATSLWIEARLLYHPRQYRRELHHGAQLQLAGQPYVIEKVTYSLPSCCSGPLAQTSILLRPEARDEGVLWAIFGGNAMLGTDWFSFCQALLAAQMRSSGPQVSMAFLLHDYPGYGGNSGRPGPKSVLEASRRAIHAALEHFDDRKTGAAPEVHLFGHSLGAAAASQLARSLAADRMLPGRLILSAPFLSIPHVVVEALVSAITGHVSTEARLPTAVRVLAAALRWPCFLVLQALLPHRWGNVVMVPAAVRAGWQLSIVHATEDRLVPVAMGRQLHRLASAVKGPPVNFREVPQCGHNDVLHVAVSDYALLMGLGDGAPRH